MKARTLLARALIAAILTAPLALPGESLADTYFGKPAKLGNGTARAYVTLDTRGKPLAIGVALAKRALEGLPMTQNKEGRCFDVNGNGKIDPGECEGDYELALTLPLQANPALIPFKWIALNWNPGGHPPPGIYDVPHFDFHFYMLGRDAVYNIRLGSCGYFMHCDDYKRALLPVEAKYVHPDHVNVNAAVGGMGNHLMDSRSPELFFKPPVKFTHTWIFGAYDGHIIFYEPMITLEFLQSAPNLCTPIKQPQAWEKSGYYPTQYCIRYHPQRAQYTVSLEGLVERKAQ